MFNPARARLLQEKLAGCVVFKDEFPPLNLVAGLDVSYFRSSGFQCGVAVVAVLEYPSLRLVEYTYHVEEAPVPYIPGLLAYREAPVLLKAYAKLRHDPDLLVVDGHGATHPRGLGIASHIGVVLDKPSIGVAKKLLAGTLEEYQGMKYIVVNGVRAGVVVEEPGRRILYVSTGHKVSPRTAYRLVVRMRRPRAGLPEPVRLADGLSRDLARKFRGSRCPEPG